MGVAQATQPGNGCPSHRLVAHFVTLRLPSARVRTQTINVCCISLMAQDFARFGQIFYGKTAFCMSQNRLLPRNFKKQKQVHMATHCSEHASTSKSTRNAI
jgi:hypothetical protein